MKLNQSSVQIIAAAAGSLVMIGGVLYLINRSSNAISNSAVGKTVGAAWETGNAVADTVTQPIASAWQQLKDFLGNNNIKFTRAEVYLNPKYFGADYRVNAAWMDAMIKGHSDIAALFKELLDSSGRVKMQYRHLIGGVMNKDTLKG